MIMIRNARPFAGARGTDARFEAGLDVCSGADSVDDDVAPGRSPVDEVADDVEFGAADEALWDRSAATPAYLHQQQLLQIGEPITLL